MQATVTDLRTDIAVLHLHGELDADTALQLHAALASLLERPVPRIVVELSGLRFCDSTGLSAFIISKQVIAARGGWLCFACASPFLQQLMETVGLTRYFTLYPDVTAAVEAATADSRADDDRGASPERPADSRRTEPIPWRNGFATRNDLI